MRRLDRADAESRAVPPPPISSHIKPSSRKLPIHTTKFWQHSKMDSSTSNFGNIHPKTFIPQQKFWQSNLCNKKNHTSSSSHSRSLSRRATSRRAISHRRARRRISSRARRLPPPIPGEPAAPTAASPPAKFGRGEGSSPAARPPLPPLLLEPAACRHLLELPAADPSGPARRWHLPSCHRRLPSHRI